MKVSDFDYDLPPDRIAQEPPARREGSRLLVLDRTTGAVEHRRFPDLVEALGAGDLLVLNDTRVLPARLVGRKPTGGRVEILLVAPAGSASSGDPVWSALIAGSRSIRPGAPLSFPSGLTVTPIARTGPTWEVALHHDGGRPLAVVDAIGAMPLPPYIRREPDDRFGPLDRERYQTVYARVPGAVAAPTAGLHFTHEILDALRRRGVAVAFLTLHVGPGTFLPVRVDEVERHVMHDEAFTIPPETAEAVAAARAAGGRVIAVGTTVARTLETSALRHGRVVAGAGRSDLFIYPGFRFRVVDALVTNFHLPRSTLLMLVCALARTEPTLAAYRAAVEAGYRFYSYGDAMLVIAS